VLTPIRRHVTNNDFLAERRIRLPLQLHRRTTTSWARPTGGETNGGQFSQTICLQKVCEQKIPQGFSLCYRVGQIEPAEQNSRRRSRFDVRVKVQSCHLLLLSSLLFIFSLHRGVLSVRCRISKHISIYFHHRILSSLG
jgi:hypothetical protein